MHLSNKGRKYYHILIGAIINDHVLNLEVITEVESGWQKSRAVQRLILVWGFLAAKSGSHCSRMKSGAGLGECLGRCTEICCGSNPEITDLTALY